jgi:hypothetical protein
VRINTSHTSCRPADHEEKVVEMEKNQLRGCQRR